MQQIDSKILKSSKDIFLFGHEYAKYAYMLQLLA